MEESQDVDGIGDHARVAGLIRRLRARGHGLEMEEVEAGGDTGWLGLEQDRREGKVEGGFSWEVVYEVLEKDGWGGKSRKRMEAAGENLEGNVQPVERNAEKKDKSNSDAISGGNEEQALPITFHEPSGRPNVSAADLPCEDEGTGRNLLSTSSDNAFLDLGQPFASDGQPDGKVLGVSADGARPKLESFGAAPPENASSLTEKRHVYSINELLQLKYSNSDSNRGIRHPTQRQGAGFRKALAKITSSKLKARAAGPNEDLSELAGKAYEYSIDGPLRPNPPHAYSRHRATRDKQSEKLSEETSNGPGSPKPQAFNASPDGDSPESTEKRYRYSVKELLGLRPAKSSTNSRAAVIDEGQETFEKISVPDSKGIPRTFDVLLSGQNANKSFRDLHLPETLLNSLNSIGVVQPTPIQLRAIPVGRLGADLLCMAKSGTGKTIAFLTIALSMLCEAEETSSRSVKGMRVLILAPTRELAQQICKVAESLMSALDGKGTVSLLIGGVPIRLDKETLAKSPVIVVGTPGRIKAHLSRGHLDSSCLQLLVIDEADRLLSTSFDGDVVDICASLPAQKQTVCFSATYSGALLGYLKSIMRNPQFVSASVETESTEKGARSGSTSSLRDFVEVLKGVAQYKLQARGSLLGGSAVSEALLCILESVPFQQCIIYSNSSEVGPQIFKQLQAARYSAAYVSGSQPQERRTSSIELMKKGKRRILVATDVAARGLDISGVDLVVMVDFSDKYTYLHRVGRAGRLGSKGLSILMYGPEDLVVVKRLESDLGIRLLDATALLGKEAGARYRRLILSDDGRDMDSMPGYLDECDDEGVREVQRAEAQQGEAEQVVDNHVQTFSYQGHPSSLSGELHGDQEGFLEEAAESALPESSWAGNLDNSIEAAWNEFAREAYEEGYNFGYREGFEIAARIVRELGLGPE